MRHQTKRLFARCVTAKASALALACLFACESGGATPEPVAVSQQPLGVLGGDIPVPVDPTTKQVRWDASYADLLAADALTTCFFLLPKPATAPRTRSGYLNVDVAKQVDPYFDYLRTKIGQSLCSNGAAILGTSNPAFSYGERYYEAWRVNRADPTCNGDAGETSLSKTIDLAPPSSASGPTQYLLPALAALGVTGVAGQDAVAYQNVQDEVFYAPLNLCIAERLREHLQSPQIAFASQEELQRLHEVARQRYLAALFQYTALVRGLQQWNGASHNFSVDSPLFYAPIFSGWSAVMATDPQRLVVKALGNDLALTTERLVSATESEVALLLRDPGAQSFGTFTEGVGPFRRGASGSGGSLTGRLSGPRADALGTLYGFEAGIETRVMAPAGTIDMSAPEVGILIGLARAADAFTITIGANKIDTGANAHALLNDVELYLQTEECAVSSEACPPTLPSSAADYISAKRHGIQYAHAVTLVSALAELIWGRPGFGHNGSGGQTPAPSVAPGGVWDFTTTQGYLDLPDYFNALISGLHTYSPGFVSGCTSCWIKLDPKFAITPGARLWDNQSNDPAVWRAFDDRLSPKVQGFFAAEAVVDGFAFGQRPRPRIGTIPALAGLREVLVDSASSVGPLDALVPFSSQIVDVVTAAVGASVTVRPAFVRTQLSGSACNFTYGYAGGYPATCTNATLQLAGGPANSSELDVDTYHKGSEPLSTLRTTYTPSGTPPLFQTGGLVANTALSSSIASLESGAVVHGHGRFTSYLWRAAALSIDSVASGVGYFWPISADHARSWTLAGNGSLTKLGGMVWAPRNDDWSKPKYDGFYQITDVIPVGDASLHGGSVGEEAYQYFLRAADQASREASTAMDRAIESLKAEATDEQALANADDRASGLLGIEIEALCGPGRCETTPSTTLWDAEIEVPCGQVTTTSGQPKCDTAYRPLWQALGINYHPGAPITKTYPLAAAVRAQLFSSTPYFRDYAGGELDGLYVEQWNAWQALKLAVTKAAGVRSATFAQYRAALAEGEAARAELDAAIADIEWAELQLGQQIDALSIQRAEYVLRFDDLMNGIAAADEEVGALCNPDVMETAFQASFSLQVDENDNGEFEGAHSRWRDNDSGHGLPDDGIINNPSNHDGRTYNAGPQVAAVDRCNQALREWGRVKFDFVVDPENPPNEVYREVLVYRYVELLGEMYRDTFGAADTNNDGVFDDRDTPFEARFAAALARKNAAMERTTAVGAQVGVQMVDAASSVQAAQARILASLAATRQAHRKIDSLSARLNLDRDLDTASIQTRFGLRRMYNSYDLWRARALTENARKLAVTARRAIEARFVVSLSSLSAAEPFVEAPSLWADEVYDSDLKPLSALGLTAAPEDASGQYTNKLVDYVNNLQLFVQGYALARPTASVRSDVDAIQLAGPGMTQSDIAESGIVYSSLGPDAASWKYWCPNLQGWIRHPGSSTFDLSDANVAEACNGSAPTRARVAFVLDPWGRQQGLISEPPYSARHNVRWQQMAVNFVGAGIRDCSRASDSLACYAEPFVRYNLKHIGPTYVTNYEEQWRELDIPVGVIEGGKALATEEWVDPVTNGFSTSSIANVARSEYMGRPIGGLYELTIELTPDVRIERVERVQLLAQTSYWVRQDREHVPDPDLGGAICGDRIVQLGETCDGNCPGYCAPDTGGAAACTSDRLIGSSDTCNVQCVHEVVMNCVGGDGCCPAGCSSSEDRDCASAMCGNGTVQAGEQCDPGMTATTTCDRDCTFASCGDGTVNAARGETCDGNCPSACSDGNACTTDALAGSVSLCTAVCSHQPITACVADGCCPSGCNSVNDVDCGPVCGNGVVETGEDCDGNCLLASACNDGLACTVDAVTGSGSNATCSASCSHTLQTTCSMTTDGCCPAGCNTNTDVDCLAVCGNGIVEAPETCDGSCPPSCVDNDPDAEACTKSTLVGAISQCTAACSPTSTPVVQCGSTVDGCCPASCSAASDNDCLAYYQCQDFTTTLSAHEAAGRVTKSCANTSPFYADGSTNNFTGSTGVTVSTTAGYFQSAPSSLKLTGAGTNPSGYFQFSTVGVSSLFVNYWRRDQNLDTGVDTFYVEYSIDGGTNYTTVNANTTWTGTALSTNHTIPLSAPQQVANFRLRFRLATTDTTEAVYLDDAYAVAYCDYRAVGSNELVLLDWGGTNATVRNDPADAAGYFRKGACPQIAASNVHSCATNNGALYCWGTNTAGQLGTGDTTLRGTPTLIGATTDFWDRIATGSTGSHTCALKAAQVFCWGSNTLGQVGDNTQVNKTSPVLANTASTWTAITAGEAHSCGLKDSGRLYCWGDNAVGQLGIGPTPTMALVPTVVGTAFWSTIKAGRQHTCGIQTSPAPGLYCWGSNGNGRLGDNTTTNRNTPTLISSGATWSAVAPGYDHTCAIRVSPTPGLYCWGNDSTTYQQVGNGSGTGNVLQPALISAGTTWSRIAGGHSTTCALNNGTLTCWGRNDYGQIGNNATTTVAAPIVVSLWGDWNEVSVGAVHACGRREGDLAYCAGRNNSRQLGTVSTANSSVYVPAATAW